MTLLEAPSDVAEICSVLIPSCDGYSDLWKPCINQFFLNWPDCPFAVYLGSDCKEFRHPRVTTIQAHAGKAWSDAVREHLRTISTEYVLMLLDDFFLRKPISTPTVLTCLLDLRRLEGNCMRLLPRPAPTTSVPGFSLVGEIPVGSPYRVSTQGAIWRRETLMQLLERGESIWQFEILGSQRSNALGGFYGTWQHVLTYKHHVVQRGKWFPQEALRFYMAGAGVDLQARKIMGLIETASWVFGKARGLALDLLPPPVRKQVLEKWRLHKGTAD